MHMHENGNSGSRPDVRPESRLGGIFGRKNDEDPIFDVTPSRRRALPLFPPATFVVEALFRARAPTSSQKWGRDQVHSIMPTQD